MAVTEPAPVTRPTRSTLIGTGDKRALKVSESCASISAARPTAAAKSKIARLCRIGIPNDECRFGEEIVAGLRGQT